MKFGNSITFTMSRLARKPIPIPSGVTMRREEFTFHFTGPKGAVVLTIPSVVIVQEHEGTLKISLRAGAENQKETPALLGTATALIKNAIEGVHAGFEKKLELEGVGYKVQLEGKDLVLSIGLTHPVRVPAPEGIIFTVEKNTILIRGADKAVVGEIAARIRAQKPPEPYKGKGIHYVGEVIRRKAGKKAVGTT